MSETPAPVEKDEELEELLDSALEDFNKTPATPAVGETAAGVSKGESSSVESQPKPEEPWNSEFLQEAQKVFEQNMKAMFGPGGDGELSVEQFSEQLNKIAEEANKVLSEQSQDPEFSATIAQTLKNLSDNSEKLQSDIGQDALSAMLGGLGLGSEEDTASDFMPFMQSMMQSFLSKEVLYPSLKEITDKYPAWLRDNKETLSESDYNNFNKQYEVMQKVCVEFEQETEADSEEVKKQRFTKILALMEEMQNLGQPPKDLCDSAPLAFSEAGSPVGLPDPSACSIM